MPTNKSHTAYHRLSARSLLGMQYNCRNQHVGCKQHTPTTRACWCISKQPPLGSCPSCAASTCRFIVNYLGNKSIALSPDVLHHALRPLRINCHAPAAKFVVGAHHSGPADHTDDSYAATAPCSRVATGCLLPVCWEYQQVRPCGGQVHSSHHEIND